jgi:hypothetical protein
MSYDLYLRGQTNNSRYQLLEKPLCQNIRPHIHKFITRTYPFGIEQSQIM